jgi:hypothetical protein
MAVHPTGRTYRFHLALVGAMIVGGSMINAVAAAAAVTPAAMAHHGAPWTVMPSPNVPSYPNLLDAISCGSATSCMAVGGYSNAETGPLIEQWDGSSWTAVAPGSPASGVDTLQGVSCASPTFCVAVGYSGDGSDTFGALEQWNGTAWTVVPYVGPDYSDLDAVSCAGPDFCMAVGTEYEYPIAADPVVVEWNGSDWAGVAPGVPTDTPDGLAGVSCTGPDACQAAGAASDVYCTEPIPGCTVIAERPLTASWDGRNWSISQPASPRGGSLDAVSCTGASACTAVGEHNPLHCNRSNTRCTSGPTHHLIETFDGSTWSVERGVKGENALASVSCSAPTTCVAITGNLIEEENGGGWSKDSPAVAPGSENQFYAGVTCTGIGPCDAVGYYDTPSAIDSLVETRSG